MYRLFHPGFDLDVDSDDPRVSNPSFPLIRDSAFIDLINLCFSRATEFSMTRGRWAASTDRSLENDLQPFLQKTIRTCNWFCYEVRPNSPLEVSVFEANETTRAIVLKYFGELFLSQYVNGKWKSSKQTLEDLCFFPTTDFLWEQLLMKYYVLSIRQTRNLKPLYGKIAIGFLIKILICSKLTYQGYLR